LLEQNDEQRGRYITLETIAPLSDDPAVGLPQFPTDQPGQSGEAPCRGPAFTSARLMFEDAALR
jgi:hypothetical protein